jgi:diguanylate cyclase (GGDEF)-like protein
LFAPAAEAGGPEENVLGGFASFLVVTNSRLVGLLALGGKAFSRLAPESAAFLGQVANQAHIVMENSRLFERVRDLSIRDGVTNLYNHRHIMELVKSELERARRYEHPFSVLMIDIDHFKKVNDEHGHTAGDAVLREVAGLLLDGMRVVDVLGRYGGEEFLAILPGTAYEEAVQTAERLRGRVGSHTFRVEGQEVRVTVSIGVATCPRLGACGAPGLVHEADKALYRAKDAGRDRTA